MYGELEMTTVLWVLFSGHLPHVGRKSGQAGPGALEKTSWQGENGLMLDNHMENHERVRITENV